MALFMIFYKGKHGPIDDFLERKTYTIGCTTHGRTYPIIYIDYYQDTEVGARCSWASVERLTA